ncbi:MAG: hypothetical protein MJ252_14870 [archaeon]|nr:hypothetical protein [archaeon]
MPKKKEEENRKSGSKLINTKDSKEGSQTKPPVVPFTERLIIRYTVDEWILHFVLTTGFICIAVLPIILYVYTPKKTGEYISRQYEKNWGNSYIIDIEVKGKDEKCSNTFDELNLGYWSGVGKHSCICHLKDGKDKSNQFATDNKRICKKGYKKIFDCKNIPKADPVELKYFRGHKFCVKRNKVKSFDSTHQTLISKGGDKASHISFLNSTEIDINQEGIIDIRISKSSNIIGYSQSGKFADGSFLHTKSININKARINQYYDLITDIHYPSKLRCSYTQMSSLQKDDIYTNLNYLNYNGNSHCYNFNKDDDRNYKELFYFDNYKRTKKIEVEGTTQSDLEKEIFKDNGIN